MNPKIIPLLLLLAVTLAAAPEEDLAADIRALKSERQLKGIQVQVTQKQQIVFSLNLG
jgi:hypothetical protein